MPIGEIVVIVLGLTLFETITSIDNAVVNADILGTMSYRWRKWFLFYGILFAVFVVRGALPLLIVKLSTPGLSFVEVFTATFTSGGVAKDAIEHQAPILLAGGGLFLVFLFLHWLFIEDKKYAFFLERHIHQRLFFWFYAIVSTLLFVVVWLSIRTNPSAAVGAVAGSTVFFIVSGFRKNAEETEKRLVSGHLTDISKVLYLELIDMTFSIDGVLGAFAFTISVPLILLGNGIGAFLVRYLTVRGIKTVKKYAYLKNGAMYSVGLLGTIMIFESFGHDVYTWLPPLLTFLLVGFFFLLSKREVEIKERAATGTPLLRHDRPR